MQVGPGALISPQTVRFLPDPRGERQLSQGRYSDFRIDLLAALLKSCGFNGNATFVPGYSGGPVPDSHRVPYSCRDDTLTGKGLA